MCRKCADKLNVEGVEHSLYGYATVGTLMFEDFKALCALSLPIIYIISPTKSDLLLL